MRNKATRIPATIVTKKEHGTVTANKSFYTPNVNNSHDKNVQKSVFALKAKQSTNEKEREMLMHEYSTRNISNTFKDRRIKTGKEIILDRFTKEFQKKISKRVMKKKKFSLSTTLTHGGVGLGDYDASPFDDIPFSEDEDRGMISAVDVHARHFGNHIDNNTGLDLGSENRKRPKAEVMRELIFKSKQYRAERQEQLESNHQLAEELDADFDAIRGLLSFQKHEPPITTKLPLNIESHLSIISGMKIDLSTKLQQSKQKEGSDSIQFQSTVKSFGSTFTETDLSATNRTSSLAINDMIVPDELSEGIPNSRTLTETHLFQSPKSQKFSFEDEITMLNNEYRGAIAHDRVMTSEELNCHLKEAENARLARMHLLEDDTEFFGENDDHALQEPNSLSGLKKGSNFSFKKGNSSSVTGNEYSSKNAMPVALLEKLLSACMMTSFNSAQISKEIENLELTLRHADCSKECLHHFITNVQERLFFETQFSPRFWMLALVVERIFSISDQRHSIGTPLIMVLSRMLTYNSLNKNRMNNLRGALLLLRLAGAGRWIIPEAISALVDLSLINTNNPTHVSNDVTNSNSFKSSSIFNRLSDVSFGKIHFGNIRVGNSVITKSIPNAADALVESINEPEHFPGTITDWELFFGDELSQEQVSLIANFALNKIQSLADGIPGTSALGLLDQHLHKHDVTLPFSGLHSENIALDLHLENISSNYDEVTNNSNGTTTMKHIPPLALLLKRSKAPKLLDPVVNTRKHSHSSMDTCRPAYKRELRGAIRELRKDTQTIAKAKHADIRARRDANRVQSGDGVYSLF